ncbi:NAD(P)/FAD-dependent oxidoreductase [Conexibacter sp. CPCC 206217]|uniref:NAD(P)/FAD-dependent oxidoreductase n=1 Tax=Conexibacter sp. CPCC 206217 TaxID=3064574 RepID=UPI0027271B85|nr:FAD-dependent oxidoreductase [Conexibacter sp. CPCC 206217]MDO8213580.1 FAD-dependent oxidoreductase [Conexibacter sp. CPCC 206217]
MRASAAAAGSAARHVVIAGGGIAAVETLLALRALPGGDGLDVTVVAPGSELVYRPLSVGEPFGGPLLRRYPLDEICADRGARFVQAAAVAVDGDMRTVTTSAGDTLHYDALVLATGACADVGLPNAVTFFADTDTDGMRWIVRELEDHTLRSIAFVVQPGSGWPLPLYELALMTAHHAATVGAGDVEITLVTPEDAPLGVFQGAGSAAVARLLDDAGIRVETSTYAHGYDGAQLLLTPGDRRLTADRVVALPVLSGPAIDGLPLDRDGFVRVDDHGRVPGLGGVYAIGDASSFPIKQGGLATQQADAVAELIVGNGDRTNAPQAHLRAMLLTGGEPLYLMATLGAVGHATSSASRQCPWWPPHKIAARHLAPYLADREPRILTTTGAAHA